MRKVTDLEKRLIANGYRLSHKEYGGRNCDKTLAYFYVKDGCFIKLDTKREKVLARGLYNYQCKMLTRMELQGIKLLLDRIDDEIMDDISIGCPNVPCDEQEVVDYIKAMTPEQFDELCLESEKK
jgi:hypothetical protein